MSSYYLCISVVVSHILDVPPQARYAHRSHLHSPLLLNYPIRVFACVKSLSSCVLSIDLCCVLVKRRTHKGSLLAHVVDLPLCWINYVPENWHTCISEESCSSSHQFWGAQSGILARPPLSYQEIALAFTHLLHDHTAIRRCNWCVNTQNEGTWEVNMMRSQWIMVFLWEMSYLINNEALLSYSAVTQCDAFPVHNFVWRNSSGFPGFGFESIRQMALHSHFTLIGHKETSSDNALSSFCLQKLLNPSLLSNLYYESSYVNGYMDGFADKEIQGYMD